MPQSKIASQFKTLSIKENNENQAPKANVSKTKHMADKTAVDKVSANIVFLSVSKPVLTKLSTHHAHFVAYLFVCSPEVSVNHVRYPCAVGARVGLGS